eukprot:gene6822-9340_t
MLGKLHISTFLPIFLANVQYAIIKRSFSASLPIMKDNLQLTKTHIGLISANFSLSYGLSKLCGGMMSDIFDPRLLFELGLLGGSLVNILIAVVVVPSSYSSTTILSFFWMMNGILQGVGGPSLTKLVVVQFDRSIIGTVWSAITFGNNLGYLISPLVLLPTLVVGWQGPFLAAGLLGLLIYIYMIISRFYLSHSTLSNQATL